MSKVTNIKQKDRKFHVTECAECGGFNGLVEQVKGYKSDRDIFEWTKEGREVKEYVKVGKKPIPFCTCPDEDSNNA